jgi:hypothetical protein
MLLKRTALLMLIGQLAHTAATRIGAQRNHVLHHLSQQPVVVLISPLHLLIVRQLLAVDFPAVFATGMRLTWRFPGASSSWVPSD